MNEELSSKFTYEIRGKKVNREDFRLLIGVKYIAIQIFSFTCRYD